MRSERVYQSDVGGPQRAGGRADRRARRWATRLLCALAALMAAGVALAATAAAQQSDEGISLVALSVTSDVAQTKMTPAFDPDVTRYEVAAPSEGDMVTVNAVAPAGESLIWTVNDADRNVSGFQVAVTPGSSSYVSVAVNTFDRDVPPKWYGVHVSRASNQGKGWRVYYDVLADELLDDL